MRRLLICLLALGVLGGALRAEDPPIATSQSARGIILDLGAAPIAGRGQFAGGRGGRGGPVAGLSMTRISVDIDRASPAVAARSMHSIPAFEWSSGGPGSSPEDMVTLHLKDAPLMQAVMEYCQQAHAKIVSITPQKITFSHVPEKEAPPWCVAGPFAVRLHGLSRQASVGDGNAKVAIVRMELIAEPGLPVTRYFRQIQCPDLVDDQHQALSIQAFLAVDYPANRSVATLATAQITLPDSPGRRIPMFRGSFSATLVSQTQRLNLGNLAARQTHSLAGMTIDVPALPAGSRLRGGVEIRISRDRMPVEQWGTLKSGLSGVSLGAVDGKNNSIGVLPHGTVQRFGSGFGSLPSPDDSVTVAFTLALAPGQAVDSATLDVPVAVQEIQIPFEFHDVILP